MYCPKCGKSIPDHAEFCPKCGLPMAKEFRSKNLEIARKKTQKKQIQIIAGVSTTAVALGVLAFCFNGTSAPKSYAELIREAENYLLDLDYDKAEVLYKEAMKIEPKNKQAYDGLYSMYELQGNVSRQKEVIMKAEEEIPGEEIEVIEEIKNPDEELIAKLEKRKENDEKVTVVTAKEELTDKQGKSNSNNTNNEDVKAEKDPMLIKEVGKLETNPVDVGEEGWIIQEGSKLRFLKPDGTIEENFSSETTKAMSSQGISLSSESEKKIAIAIALKTSSSSKTVQKGRIVTQNAKESSENTSDSTTSIDEPIDIATFHEEATDHEYSEMKDKEDSNKEELESSLTETNNSEAEIKKEDLWSFLLLTKDNKLIDYSNPDRKINTPNTPILTVRESIITTGNKKVLEQFSEAKEYYISSPGNKEIYGPYTRENPGCFAQKLWMMEKLVPESTLKTEKQNSDVLQNTMGPYWIKESKDNKPEYKIYSWDGKKNKSGFESVEVISPEAIGAIDNGEYILMDKNLNVLYQGEIESAGKPIRNAIPVKEKGIWKLVKFDLLKEQKIADSSKVGSTDEISSKTDESSKEKSQVKSETSEKTTEENNSSSKISESENSDK